jgi:COMPASS component SWD1
LRFDAPLTNAQFHPRNSEIILATLSSEVVLVDLRKGGGTWSLRHDLEEEDEMVDGMEVDEDQQTKPAKKRYLSLSLKEWGLADGQFCTDECDMVALWV